MFHGASFGEAGAGVETGRGERLRAAARTPIRWAAPGAAGRSEPDRTDCGKLSPHGVKRACDANCFRLLQHLLIYWSAMKRMATYPAPWKPVGPEAENLQQELKRELTNGHPLFGVKAIATAKRDDQDDVLFLLESGPAQFAIVHLTWSGSSEPSPQYPITRLCSSLDELTE